MVHASRSRPPHARRVRDPRLRGNAPADAGLALAGSCRDTCSGWTESAGTSETVQAAIEGVWISTPQAAVRQLASQRSLHAHVIAVALATVALMLPQHGVVVPGKSFGGLRLGSSAAQVRAAWGDRHGRCLDCTRLTWYFTYERFEPQGAGASFRSGAVDAFFTIWSPPGLAYRIGVSRSATRRRASPSSTGSLPRAECGTYSSLVLRRGGTDTQFFVYRGKVWGFGLSSAGAPPCH